MDAGRWSAGRMATVPGVRLDVYLVERANVGFQLGGQATDFVLLVMNGRGAEQLLKDKTKIGADASAAGGPVGRSAEGATDLQLHAEILTYSRARGAFAGVSLDGQMLRQDADSIRLGVEVTLGGALAPERVGLSATRTCNALRSSSE